MERTIENKSCSTTGVDPKIFLSPTPIQKHSPLGPQKLKNDTKVKSKSKVRIEGTIEDKSYSTTRVDPKTVFNPTPPQK